MTNSLRNIAIIAHVDHGKTTLIDNLLKQSGLFRDNQHVDERIMDSGDLEKERGITILAKPTSVIWKDTRINIIDTPGHADFGGEVERILGMTDGVILLVDAAEGPMPQTKFVLSKALALGLRPIVVINKVDRSDARSKEVINEIFDLFVALDANDQQLDFPVLYASGRDGWCNYELDQERKNLHPLLDLILNHVPEPDVDLSKPFAMLSTLLHSDSFLGRCLIGRVVHGIAKVNDTVKSLNLDNKKVEEGRLTKLFTFSGTSKVPTDNVMAGDIVTTPQSASRFHRFQGGSVRALSELMPPAPFGQSDHPLNQTEKHEKAQMISLSLSLHLLNQAKELQRISLSSPHLSNQVKHS